VRFTLTESVDYALSGTFNGILNPDTGTIPGNLAVQEIYGDLGSDAIGLNYAGTSQLITSGPLSLTSLVVKKFLLKTTNNSRIFFNC
jgi:hypothetical protein